MLDTKNQLKHKSNTLLINKEELKEAIIKKF